MTLEVVVHVGGHNERNNAYMYWHFIQEGCPEISLPGALSIIMMFGSCFRNMRFRDRKVQKNK